jgi:hypothetical protein
MAQDLTDKEQKIIRNIMPDNPRKELMHTITNAASVALSRETLYLDKLRVREPSKLARDAALAAELWEFSAAASS